MKKIIAVVLLLFGTICFGQDITNTIATDGDFIIKDASNTYVRVKQSNGYVAIGKNLTALAPVHIGGNDGFLSTGTFGTGTTLSLGAGERMHWYPKKTAFRAGKAYGTEWDDANIGAVSFAFGVGATANSQRGVAIGTVISTNGKSHSFIFGDNSASSVTNCTANNQMMMRFDGGYMFYTKSDLTTGAQLTAGATSWSSISDSTKKENFIFADGETFLKKLQKLRLGSWNYKGQNPKMDRHYGAMAQEIFHHFGKDQYGTIGVDTLVNTLDMDGLIMICLQALEKRTAELKTKMICSRQKMKS